MFQNITYSLKKVVNYIKRTFSIYEIVLLCGAIFMIPLSLLNSYYMNQSLPNHQPFPFWFGLFSGIVTILTSLTYLLRHLIQSKNRIHLFLFIYCALVIIANIITILVNPDEIVVDVLVKAIWLPTHGQKYSVETLLSWQMRTIYIILFTSFLLFVFDGIFIFPKVISSKQILVFLSFFMYIAFIVSIIFSIFYEGWKYGAFLSFLANPSGDVSSLSEYSLVSFFSHRNIYSLFIVMVVLSSLIAQAISKKMYHFIVTLVAVPYLIFTYSKSIIAICYCSLVVYAFIFILLAFKNDPKKRSILLSVLIGLLLLMTITIVVLFYTNKDINHILSSLFSDFGTLVSRKSIWATVMEYMDPRWYLFGRGYGIGETILSNVGVVAIGEYIPHEHSWFFSMFSKGGILLVTTFIGFIVYLVIQIIKLSKMSFLTALPFIVGIIIFFAHSFLDNSYYMLFVFAALLNVALNDNSDNHLLCSNSNILSV